MVKVLHRLLWCLVFLSSYKAASAEAAEIIIVSEAQLLELREQAGQPICLSGCLQSEQDAHYAAASSYFRIAIETRRELNWRVYRMPDGTYTYSYPMAGESGATSSRMAPIAAGATYLNAGHIHWDEVPGFSPLDWQWVAGNQRDLYLVNQDGVLRVLTPSMTRRSRSGQLATPYLAVNLNGRRVKELPRASANTEHPEAAGSPNP